MMREVLIVDLGAPPPRCEAAFAYTPYQHSAHQVLGRRRSFRPEFSCLIIMQLLVVALTAFTESERFERWGLTSLQGRQPARHRPFECVVRGAWQTGVHTDRRV